MNKHIKKTRNEEMYQAILQMQTVEECMKFFDDLCTVSELQVQYVACQKAILSNMARRKAISKSLENLFKHIHFSFGYTKSSGY